MAALIVVFVVVVLLVEGLSRLADEVQTMALPIVARLVNAGLPLNQYQQPSSTYIRHWTLLPGFVSDASRLADAKRSTGRLEGARLIEEAAARGFHLPLEINADGFKGPPLFPQGTRPRLLAVGDSVTFGIGGWDWVRAMQSELATRGIIMEGVNAGVEGYGSRNVRLEMPRYRDVGARVCVVMIGWNDLFAEDGSYGTVWGGARSLALVRRGFRLLARLVGERGSTAHELRTKALVPVLDDPQIERYRHYVPPFLPRVEAIGEALAATGCRVALATLPGLYLPDTMPTPRALAIGHLPAFTDNPLVLAAMTESTNRAYRDLAARRGWQLIDLDQWSRDALVLREVWYTDSVHLTAQGQSRMGTVFADAVAADFAR